MCHAAAEGEGYGSGKAYGNSSAYLAFAGLQTGLAGLMAALPESVRLVRSRVVTAHLAPCHPVHMLAYNLMTHLPFDANTMLPCPAGT